MPSPARTRILGEHGGEALSLYSVLSTFNRRQNMKR